jgi:ribosomal protein S18 acetylase RimI-like enzyme
MSETILTSTELEGFAPSAAPQSTLMTDGLCIESLTNGQEPEVLSFLAQRPLHTFVMAGHIRDNGLESCFNRGRFYGCRNGAGLLEGVALIGHFTLMETRSEAVLRVFARLAQSCSDIHLMMGEEEKIQRFWRHYAAVDQLPRSVGRELLFEQRWPADAFRPVPDLRLATLADLEQVMLVQGQMAFSESGINPLENDPEGFRTRCARRIEQKRVWVWAEDRRLIFKADVISDTPEAIYLEGIHVDPRDRGKGIGTRCMSQLAQTLLARTDSLCVFVNEQSPRALSFFEQQGFKLCSYYETIFLRQK